MVQDELETITQEVDKSVTWIVQQVNKDHFGLSNAQWHIAFGLSMLVIGVGLPFLLGAEIVTLLSISLVVTAMAGNGYLVGGGVGEWLTDSADAQISADVEDTAALLGNPFSLTFGTITEVWMGGNESAMRNAVSLGNLAALSLQVGTMGRAVVGRYPFPAQMNEAVQSLVGAITLGPPPGSDSNRAVSTISPLIGRFPNAEPYDSITYFNDRQSVKALSTLEEEIFGTLSRPIWQRQMPPVPPVATHPMPPRTKPPSSSSSQSSPPSLPPPVSTKPPSSSSSSQSTPPSLPPPVWSTPEQPRYWSSYGPTLPDYLGGTESEEDNQEEESTTTTDTQGVILRP